MMWGMQKMNISLLTVAESQTNTWIDNLAIVISLISLVSTIILAMITYWQNQKLKIVDLEANYFITIYQGFLCKKIPQARASLKFLNGKLEGDQQLLDVLNEMRRDSAYFKYVDESFYESVVDELREVEDGIVNINNGPPKNMQEEAEFFMHLTSELQKLYRIISKRYHGQKK